MEDRDFDRLWVIWKGEIRVNGDEEEVNEMMGVWCWVEVVREGEVSERGLDDGALF